MKKEGRQHVRRRPELPDPTVSVEPETRLQNLQPLRLAPHRRLARSGFRQPANHSKFTCNCDRPRCSKCHIHRATKSKDKVKAQKVPSSNTVLSYGLRTWRVVDPKPRLNFAGFCAIEILDHLGGEYDEEGDFLDVVYEESCYLGNDGLTMEASSKNNADDGGNGDDDENNNMSFCDVALGLDRVDEDEGWCLVGEMLFFLLEK
ncbi:hypothetical protein NMG60_11030205 [Bertholletia excelsa]